MSRSHDIPTACCGAVRLCRRYLRGVRTADDRYSARRARVSFAGWIRRGRRLRKSLYCAVIRRAGPSSMLMKFGKGDGRMHRSLLGLRSGRARRAT